MDCSMPGFPVLHIPWNMLRLMFIESMMPSNHLTLCCSLLLPPSIFPSIRVFSNESVLCIRWPKYWNFNFSISPSNEYIGLIFFRIDLFDFLAVQGTLKSFSSTTVWKYEPHEQCVKVWFISVGYKISRLCMESWQASHIFLLAEDWRWTMWVKEVCHCCVKVQSVGMFIVAS